MLRCLAIWLACLSLACSTPRQENAAPDLAAVRAQVDTLWATYSRAAIAGDADALARLYMDDAYLVESGLPTVRGNSALRAVVKDVLESVRFLEASITPELTELAGDRVLQFGTYRDVLQPTGQPAQVVVGRFAAVLQRDSAAVWKLSRLVAVADSTVPHSTSSK